MICLPDLNAGSPKTRRTAWWSTSRGFCRDGLGLRHWSQPAHVRYGTASAHHSPVTPRSQDGTGVGPKSQPILTVGEAKPVRKIVSFFRYLEMVRPPSTVARNTIGSW